MIRTTMPDMWPKLKSEADHYMGVDEKLTMGERNLGGPLMLSGLASSYFTGGIPVAEAFGAGAAWSLMSDTGKKTLDAIFKHGVKNVAKSTLHLGGSSVDLKPSH